MKQTPKLGAGRIWKTWFVVSNLLPCSLISLDYRLYLSTNSFPFISIRTHLAPCSPFYPTGSGCLGFVHPTAIVFNVKACTPSSGWITSWRSIHIGKQPTEKARTYWRLVCSSPIHLPSASSIFWNDKLQVIWHILPLLYACRRRWTGKLRVQEGTTKGQEKKVLSVTWVLVTQALTVWIHMHADNTS